MNRSKFNLNNIGKILADPNYHSKRIRTGCKDSPKLQVIPLEKILEFKQH